MSSVVEIRRGRSRPLWAGHPWVYRRAIKAIDGSPPAGECVQVVDHEQRVIGWGHFSQNGPIAVRMISRREDRPEESDWVAARIATAAQRRGSMGLPSSETNVFRLVFGEGDALPGLVIDRMGEGLVVQAGTPAMLRLEETIIEALRAQFEPKWIVFGTSAEAARMEELPTGERLVWGEEDDVADTWIRESGLEFRVDPIGGQKTGFYTDQRENRRTFAAFAKGRRVLDAYAYTGAFGLGALAAGAQSAQSVDSSPRTCRLARKNATRNDLALDVVESDVINHLRQVGPQRPFDAIALDPPKFARTKSGTPEALKKYRKLNELAMRSLPAGGLLLTCTCSGHVTPPDFHRMLTDAAFRAGRTLQIVETRGQAPDHPTLAAWPEGRYLTAVFAFVADRE